MKPPRIYDAICELIEAWAELLRTGTLENEFETADWESGDG